jgi:NAD(P)-dependent dehydrogenase (short-subunit alcohol dehydrogenase family)
MKWSRMKTILVTGASGNLGEAVTKKFLDNGCRVIGTLMPNDPAVKSIDHSSYETREVDLSNENTTKQMTDGIISQYKSIDAAVLTVGGFAMGTITETSISDINKQIKLNFETAYNVARPVFLQMLSQGSGRIFLVGARPGISMLNSKGTIAYGLAKSLIFRLGELLNEEAGKRNIVTTVIVPSTIDTPQNRRAMPDAKFEEWVSPDAIANLIFYYCSEEASNLRQPVLKIYGQS